MSDPLILFSLYLPQLLFSRIVLSISSFCYIWFWELKKNSNGLSFREKGGKRKRKVSKQLEPRETHIFQTHRDQASSQREVLFGWFLFLFSFKRAQISTNEHCEDTDFSS